LRNSPGNEDFRSFASAQALNQGIRTQTSSGAKRRLLPWWIVLVLVVAGVTVYAVIGQWIIAAVYASESSWVDVVLRGRASTPLEAYYRQGDQLVLRSSLWLIVGYGILRAVLRQPLGLFISAVSFVLTSFLLFCFFEAVPSLVPLFRLDAAFGYYAYKTNYLPDSELVFVEKPFNRALVRGFAGASYSRLFGVDVPPTTIEWAMDQNGFRNDRRADSADLVLLGDSYLEYGSTQSDTFGNRLEQKLGGLTVRNLGKSGYSPFQYLVVLKRYGLRYRPRYAVMAVYEGNDLHETRDYLVWRGGHPHQARGYLFRFSTDSLIARYWAALASGYDGALKAWRSWRELILQRIAQRRGYAPPVHPDIAILNLRGKTYPKLFIDRFTAAASEELLARREFAAVGEVFAEFRRLCETERIMPIVLYIPAAAHVYAAYSTRDSGDRWLRARGTQIAASENTESAVSSLARRAGVEFLSLTPVFRHAAEEGKMLYYALDAHWNEEGRELAARFLAQALQLDKKV
jgi:hypothetical protein